MDKFIESVVLLILELAIWYWIIKAISKAYKKYKEKTKERYSWFYSNNFINRDIDLSDVQVASREEQSNLDKNSKELDTSKSPFLMAYSLLTQAEMNFYKVLITVVDREKYTICPKVRMIDVLWMKTYKAANKQAFFNKIVRKHFDFVVCYADSLKPVYAIELDDKSHQWEERKERDEFVDSMFSSLNFNVIHIPVQYSYNVEELKVRLGLLETIEKQEV